MYTDLINGDMTHYHYKPSPYHISGVTVFQLCMYGDTCELVDDDDDNYLGAIIEVYIPPKYNK